MIALPILTGLLAGVLVNWGADRVSIQVGTDGTPVRFPFGTLPSWRHAIVQLALLALYLIIWTPFGARAESRLAITNTLISLYGAILVLVLITDLEHRLVPHAIMLPAIALATLASFVNPTWESPKRPLLGGALGLACGLTLYLGGILFARLLGRIRGRPISETAFGFGDVTLLTFIGLIVGAPEILLALVIGVFSAGIFGLLFVLWRGLVEKESALLTAIPYAPFLILGGTIMLVFGHEVMAWYLRGM